jgi:ribosome-associated protein
VTSIRITKEIQLVIDSVQEKKAEDVTVLDLQKLTSFTDYFVICSGESEPQIRTIFKNVEEKLKAAGIELHHMEGKFETGWVLMDYRDFVVHIFSPEKRMYYELERLWGDAPRMEISDPVSASRSNGNRARVG